MARDLRRAAAALGRLSAPTPISDERKARLFERVVAQLEGGESAAGGRVAPRQLAGRRGWPTHRFVLGLCVAAVAVALLVVVLLIGDEPGQPPTTGATQTHWARVEQRHRPCAHLKGGTLRFSGTCGRVKLLGGDDTARALAASELVHDNTRRDLRLRRGRLQLTVRRRATAERRFELRVSHGTLTSTGGRFTVVQRMVAGGSVVAGSVVAGSVVVERGEVVLRFDDGRQLDLGPKQRASWPAAPSRVPVGKGPASSPASAKPSVPTVGLKPRRASSSRPGTAGGRLNALLQRHFQLVSQRRYREAAKQLQSVLRRPASLTRAQRARLSYQLGRLIEDELHQPKRACQHWRGHRKRYGGLGRYDVSRRLERCR